MSEEQKRLLEQQLWNIANELLETETVMWICNKKLDDKLSYFA